MTLLLFCCSLLVWGVFVPSSADDLEVIRQTELHPTSLVRVVDPSDAAELEVQAIANASSTLSNISLADIENDNITHTLQMKYRERKRQERLFVIQTQILQRLRIQKQPNITSSIFSEDDQKKIEMLVGRMQNMGAVESDLDSHVRLHVQRLQSFYPSCSLPNNTDKAMWENPSSFRIYYDIPFSRRSSGTEVTIMRAKLRLYQVGNYDVHPNFVGWQTQFASSSRFRQLDGLFPRAIANSINVNIFQFLKPLRFNRKERKRLIDSRTIPGDYQGWVEFDVLPALNFWLQHSNRNYGFEVTVEDAFGNKLNGSLHFQNMNCSGESATQDPPFPNFMELNTDMGENESSLFDNETYPTLDLKTAEISRENSEVQVGDFSSHILKKRHVYNQKFKKERKGSCHMERMFVYFDELGLNDVIIAPNGIEWAFCWGSCDAESRYKRKPIKTSVLQSFIRHWKFPGDRNQESSCTAGAKHDFSVLYYDPEEEKVNFTIIRDFIPTHCVCKSTL